MRRFGFLFFLGALSLLFWGCPTTPIQNDNYLQSPLTFVVDTVPAVHPYCSLPSTQIPFPSLDSCQNTKKFVLRWEQPQDTTGFVEYRIYLDTNPPNAVGQTWTTISTERSLASAIIPGVGGPADSLVFIFNSTPSSTNVFPRGPGIVTFDSTGRSDAQGRLVFAIVTVYSSGSSGEPRYTYLINTDKFPPNPMLPVYTPYARSMEIDWSRPPDPTSFFDPGADSGIIQEYVLRLERGSVLSVFNPADSFSPQVTFFNGGANWSSRVKVSSFTTVHGAPGREFVLPDSQHVFDFNGPDPRDSLKVIVSGLIPLDTVEASLWAIDLAGNTTDSTLMTRVILTDTTTPTTPQLKLDSVAENGFVFSFTDSRDLVQSGAILVPSDSPNGNILQYHIIRRLLAGSTGGIANADSIAAVNSTNSGDTLFTDTVSDLPPGTSYRIYVQAMDSTGHLSLRDSLDVATLTNSFKGPDSGFTCPAGFVAIPASHFQMGDTSTTALPNSTPPGQHYITSYCIENYEHRDATGAFQIHMTWQQAKAACQAVAPQDNSHLCTEAEWERACKGSDDSTAPPPLTYGFQSEDPNNPNALFNVCNVGTGDSEMAVTQSLRNPNCLTREGAFDMTGNLAEWVLDTYDSTVYQNAIPDTLYPGQPLVPPVDTATHGFRGGYYLNTHLATSTVLQSAKCANRDYPKQVRPQIYAGCMDSTQPLVVLTYDNPALAPLCVPIPASIPWQSVTSVLPSPDTLNSQILFLVSGVAQPVPYNPPAIPQAYQYNKPISAQLTPLSVAALTFVNSQTGDEIADTLNAAPLLVDTSDATLTALFGIEVAPPWSVLRVNGHYAIHYLYAYSVTTTIPARRQYSNSVIGFRCCSLPQQP